MSEAPLAHCRLCHGALAGEPLLHYGNMPRAAQGFPDAQALPFETGADLTVCQCAHCGLVQLTQAPVPYYREVIRAAGISPVLQEAKRAQFRAFVERFSLQGKKVLEVGCGRGEFLSLLEGLEVVASGLEFSEEAVEACRQQGLRVHRGYLEAGAPALPGGPFDAFLLLMFLEHFPDPAGSLRSLHGNLAPGAVGLVEVPNFDMVVRSRLFSEFIADHLMYFTTRTLETTLALHGFEVLECREARDAYVLSALVRKRERLDLGPFREHQARIESELSAFLEGFPARSVAVWGAGHQALALLAMAGLGGRIRYVVDSAPFKQGRFTPATHLPVVPPGTLRDDPVAAVIVMAASYSDEVAGLLRRDFDPGLKVCILREHGLEPIQ